MKNMQDQAAKAGGGAATTKPGSVDPTGPPGSTATGTSAPGGMAAQNGQGSQGTSIWSTFKFW